MEAVRTQVDSYVLDLLENRAFKKNDFFETREGVCRLMPSISLDLVQTGQRWSKQFASVTEFVAKNLMQETPTLLTESNRSAGRTEYRRAAQTSTENSPICTQRRKRTVCLPPLVRC